MTANYHELYVAAFKALIAHHGAGESNGLTPDEVASFAEDYAKAALVKLTEGFKPDDHS